MYSTGSGITAALVAPARPPAGVRLRITQATAPSRVVATGNVTTTQITGLQPANTYRMRVRALDAAGNASGWSDEVVLITLVGPPITAVAATASIPALSVSVSGGGSVSPATVAATASIPQVGVRHIPLTTVAATAAVPPVSRQMVFSSAGTTVQATGLVGSSNYVARVRARDAAGNWSAYSDPVPFTTLSAGIISVAPVAATAAFPAMTVGGAPPTLVAGRARPVVNGQGVQLDVSATPPNGQTIAAYSWQIISGGGSLTGASTATPTYTAPGSGAGLATVRVAVSTANAGVATVDMTVSYHSTIVAAENALPGTPRASWDLSSPNLGGVATLLGFCDGFTVDKTGTANFKIASSDGASWTAEIFRLGYYGGDGARSYGTLTPSGGQLTASQAQPAPGDVDPDTTQLSADCSNWATTLTWTPPSWVPSGMYVLKLNRNGGGASHVQFIVRDDARQADLMFMPADSTWNAYNAFGGMGAEMYNGNSLYRGVAVDQYSADCARFVSYNRPFVNRGAADSGRSYGAVEWSTFFTGEYPMLRFLERNGFDVKYYGCIDAGGDAAGTHLIGNGSTRGGVSAAMLVGHNEYWSDGMRAGWEAARNAGVSIFSCAGNEVFWRTYGSAPDAQGRPRTFECYKSTIASRGSTGRTQWTGSWRDPDGAGKGGNNPENSFTGTIFVVNGPTLRSLAVPFDGGYAAQPIWRHTSVASLTSGQVFTSPNQILGFEWDTYGPAGTDGAGAAYMATPHPKVRYCSNVTHAISGDLLIDAGDVYGSGNATHRLVVYPGGGNALVFGTGTINWALGVDDANTYQMGNNNVSPVIQQATVNMLVDMGAPPASLMSGLTEPTPVDWYVDVAPATVAATASVPAVSPMTSSMSTVAPATVTATAAVPAIAVSQGTRATLVTAQAVSAVPAPTLRAGSQTTLTTVGAAASVPAATVAASSFAALTAVAATTAVPAPTLRASSQTALAMVGAVAAIPAATVATSSSSSAALTAVAATTAIPSVALRSGSAPQLTTVAATAAVPVSTASVSVTADPTTMAATAAMDVAIVQASATATAQTAQASAAVAEPIVLAGAGSQASLATIAATAAVPSVSVRSGSRILLATTEATSEVGPVFAATGVSSFVELDAIEASSVIPSLGLTSGTRAGLATVAATAATPTVAVRVSQTATPPTVAVAASVPAVALATASGASVQLVSVAAKAGVAAPAVGAASQAAVALQPALAKASIPALVVQTATIARPVRVQAVAFVWQPSFGAEADIVIPTVAATTAIGQVKLQMLPVAKAHPHMVVVKRNTHGVIAARSTLGITI